jgi:hypothetical protein
MVGERTRQEFERDGVEAVRQQVEQGAYWEGKKQQAIKWLNQQDPHWKRDRDTKALLKLARRTARDTRLALVLLGLILLFLIAAVVAWFFIQQGAP